MAALSQSIRRKLSLLKLAEELGVSKACKIMGYHRDSFYEVGRAFQSGGVSALVEEKRGPRALHPTAFQPRSKRESSTTRWRSPLTERSASNERLEGMTVSSSGLLAQPLGPQ